MPPRKKPSRKRSTRPTAAQMDQAQMLTDQAAECSDFELVPALLEQALELDPGCTDARLMLIELFGAPIELRVEMLQDIADDAAKRLGEDFFAEHVGHFWGILETRPYMRARHQLAEAYEALGDEARAVAEYRDLLHLCPGDNLGVRYPLLALFLALGQLDHATALCTTYQDDASGTAAWGAVLERFLVGTRDEARKALHRARELNPHAEPYLAGRQQLPAVVPDSWSFGDEDEAEAVACDLGEAYRRHPEAMVWLREEAGRG